MLNYTTARTAADNSQESKSEWVKKQDIFQGKFLLLVLVVPLPEPSDWLAVPWFCHRTDWLVVFPSKEMKVQSLSFLCLIQWFGPTYCYMIGYKSFEFESEALSFLSSEFSFTLTTHISSIVTYTAKPNKFGHPSKWSESGVSNNAPRHADSFPNFEGTYWSPFLF